MRILASALVITLCVPLGACGSAEKGAPDPVAAPAVLDGHDRLAEAKAAGLELKQFDLNRDQEPDVFKYYRLEDDPQNAGNKLELLVRKEIDINHDGKVDVIRLYNDGQQVIEERTDLDFDGRIDEVATFDAGLLMKKEIDLNYDTKPDLTKYYDEGKLARIESDRNDDGMVDTWEYFVDGELDRIGTDTDRDGKVDDWERRRVPPTDAAKQAAPSTADSGQAGEGADQSGGDSSE